MLESIILTSFLKSSGSYQILHLKSTLELSSSRWWKLRIFALRGKFASQDMAIVCHWSRGMILARKLI